MLKIKKYLFLTTSLFLFFDYFREPWEKSEIFDRTVRNFKAVIGPSGGKRGYQGITGTCANI